MVEDKTMEKLKAMHNEMLELRRDVAFSQNIIRSEIQDAENTFRSELENLDNQHITNIAHIRDTLKHLCRKMQLT